MIKLSVKSFKLADVKADVFAVFLFEGENPPKELDSKLGGYLSSLVKGKKFSGKKLSVRQVDTLGKLKAECVLLVGLGKKEDFSAEVLRAASAKAATSARSARGTAMALSIGALSSKKHTAEDLAQAAGEGIILSLYKFDQYKKKPEENGAELRSVVFACGDEKAETASGLDSAEKICRAVYLARDLGNHPGNTATPTFLASNAQRECRKVGVKCRVLEKREIEKLGMGSFLAVARGSAEPPKFIIMEYLNGRKNEKPIVLVGKGLTFDTGGISIKPSGNMEDMKFDMSGGGAVIGAMVAAASLKIKKNIVGLVPCTENMPGGRAIKPGDLARSMVGLTVEIINTDAEGRLILADALGYAKKYKPRAVVDLATLTGACMVALGTHASGLFGTDQKLVDAVRAAGENAGERCWQLPLWEEYDEQIKSSVADVKNVGDRYGGAITAAAFLKKFTDYPWAHIDIAGTAYGAKPGAPYLTAGSAGIGVRLLVGFLKSF
ncbi:MAG: leucyl aminopeptidase [Nitrospinae bacterium]|nr:leucyl aminopeptidase [Nitrospinota bacterium]